MVVDVFATHILGKRSLSGEMAMRETVTCNENDTLSTLFNRLATSPSERSRLFIHDLNRVIVAVAITTHGHDGFVPLWIQQMAGCDGAVINTEIRIAHHLGDNARLFCQFTHLFGQFDIDFEIVVVAEQIRENRIHRE